MSAFTNPADWVKHGQDLAGANEIVLAYSERRQVRYMTAVSNLSAGDSAQHSTLWRAMQDFLEAYCLEFVDHVSGPFDGTSVKYFTLADWQTTAGLNVSATPGESFRRVTEIDGDGNPVYLYGWVRAGDIFGPWIFEDLQKGFGALKWTALKGPYGLADLQPRIIYDMDEAAGTWTSSYALFGLADTVEEAISLAQAAFETNKSNSAMGWPLARSAIVSAGAKLYNRVYRNRSYFTMECDELNVAVASCEFWGRGTAAGNWHTYGDPVTTVFSKILDKGPAAKGTNLKLGWIGEDDSFPVFSGGYTPPSTEYGYYFQFETGYPPQAIAKWDFTNA